MKIETLILALLVLCILIGPAAADTCGVGEYRGELYRNFSNIYDFAAYADCTGKGGMPAYPLEAFVFAANGNVSAMYYDIYNLSGFTNILMDSTIQKPPTGYYSTIPDGTPIWMFYRCQDFSLTCIGHVNISGTAPPNCNFTVTPQLGEEPLRVNVTGPDGLDWYNYHLYLPGSGPYIRMEKTWTSPYLEAGSWELDLEGSFGGNNCSFHYPDAITVTGTGNETIILNMDVKDATTGALVYDSNIGIYDVNRSVWRNGTAPTGLVYFETTGPTYQYPLYLWENITLAAWKTGYHPADMTFAIPYNNYHAILNLMPTSVVNATGKFTLVVTVVADKDGTPISGVSVSLDTGEMKTTNTAGAAMIYNVTAGNRTITASAPLFDYQMASKTITGIPGETRLVSISLVRNGETPVPTWATPVPTATDAMGIKGGTNETDYRVAAINERASFGLSEAMDFVGQAWPLVFLFGLMYFMRKATG